MSEPTNIQVVQYAVWYFDNKPIAEIIASLMDKSVDDAYVKHNADLYRKNFSAFWAWMDSGLQREYLKMSKKYYHKE
jgi:hemolysin-activating ACP:hemolysin acyltransferase